MRKLVTAGGFSREHSIIVVFALALSAALGIVPQRVQASGWYFTERGVRSLGRGGAFVAGAKGAESLWINPAGLKGSGNSFTMEGNLNFLRGSFQRLDDAGTVRAKEDVEIAYLPIPMFAVTKDFGLEDFSFGFGVYLPQFAVTSWPSQVNGGPAPNRYSLYSIKGSIFGNFTAGVAYHGIPGLSLGLTAALITGRFKASTALSACDGFLCVNPEDPTFDVTASITMRRFASVMIGAGLIYDMGPVSIGASLQPPWNMKGRTDLDVTLPSDPAFSQAKIEGTGGKMDVPFPWIGRVGVEVHPSESFRFELAAVYEGWSRQDEITVKANDMWIRDVIGIGDYQVGSIKIQRMMSDAYSFRGGFEYFMEDMGLTLRMGASYDTTAIKDKAMSPMTLDANKVVAGMGVTLHAGSVLDIDVLYGHVFMPDRQIRNSEIIQPTAIRPPQSAAAQSHIGNGTYTMESDFAGLGATFHF
ncbi:MAG: outer membrane protein transport protein [Myxococcales bacterium]